MKTIKELSQESGMSEKRFTTRADGRIEWTCKHGVGHTVAVPRGHQDSSAWWSHGCCHKFCCKNWREKKDG